MSLSRNIHTLMLIGCILRVVLHVETSDSKWHQYDDICFNDKVKKTNISCPIITSEIPKVSPIPYDIPQLQEDSGYDNDDLIKVQVRMQDPGKPSIAIIPLKGIIGLGGITYDTYKSVIDIAFDTPNLQAVLLNIDSPGGSPTQSELITDYIYLLAYEKGIKVYSFVQDFAVSGGYWIACAGEKIYVSKTSEVGSIGVVHHSFGFEDAIKSLNIKRRVMSAGSQKSSNDPFTPQTDEDKAKLKEKLGIIHQIFIDHVRESRKQTIKEEKYEELFNGSTWIGQQAIEMGLADGVQTIDSFIRSTFGGPTNVNMFIYTMKMRVIPMIPGSSIQKKESCGRDNDSHNIIDVRQQDEVTLSDIEILDKYDSLLQTIEKNVKNEGENELKEFHSAVKMLKSIASTN